MKRTVTVALDPTQQRTLRKIAEAIDGGLPPSVRELLPVARVSSTGSMGNILKGLERLGLIVRKSTARGIFLTELGRRHVSVGAP